VVGVHNRLVVTIGTTDFLGHGQFRHGEERSWGGYGGGWYEREPRERERDERDRRP
jgi:hypothetical protein